MGGCLCVAWKRLQAMRRGASAGARGERPASGACPIMSSAMAPSFLFLIVIHYYEMFCFSIVPVHETDLIFFIERLYGQTFAIVQ